MKRASTSEEDLKDRDKRRKLNGEAPGNAEEPIRDEPKSKRDGSQQKAECNKNRRRKKVPSVRVTRAVKIFPRHENIPALTLPIPPNGPSANYVFTNENAPSSVPAFNGIRGHPPPIMQPQELSCGGAGQQAQNDQARIMQPQQLPHGGDKQEAQNSQGCDVAATTAVQGPSKEQDPMQCSPGAQLQSSVIPKLEIPKNTNVKNTWKSTQNTPGTQAQSHGIPNTEVPSNTHIETIYKPIRNTPSSQLQSRWTARPQGIAKVEIPKTAPITTIQTAMKDSSLSQLQSQGKPNIPLKETHARIAQTTIQGSPVPQLQSTEIERAKILKNAATRSSPNPMQNPSGFLLRTQPYEYPKVSIPSRTRAITAHKPNNATGTRMQIRELSSVEFQKNKAKSPSCTSVQNIFGAPQVQHRQPRRTNFEIGNSTSETRAGSESAGKGYMAASQARMKPTSSSGLRLPKFTSHMSQNLQSAPPHRKILADYPFKDQRFTSHTEPNRVPSWAIGRPLCHYLFNKEIGDVDHRLHSQDPTSTAISEIHAAAPSGTENIEPELETIPISLPHQPYLTWTWAHEISTPKPLDNLTSFSRAFPSGFNMWPCLSLERIRDKSFLPSCNDKVLLRLMGRYLMEHALDQIARCDPSSELEPKWLVTPKNLYEEDTSNLIPKQDKQKGLRCSCKSAREQNRSGRYGVSCSDEKCENRAMNIECVPGKCGGGESCKNTRIQRQQFPKVILQKYLEKGYAVLARETIPAGAMIGEYVGEVLNAEMFKNRMMKYDGEHNFYFMSLTPKLYIDASRKGGIGRFINHSCDPNCVAEKWNAGGEPHIAIVAIREIRPYEEITFSYQAQLVGTRAVRCLCGSECCRGWLTPRSLLMTMDREERFSKKESVVAKKVELAHSDILLAEEILERVYGCFQL